MCIRDSVTLTGVSATGLLTAATASLPVIVNVTGTSATSSVGTVTQSTSITAILTGVEATGAVGGTSMWIEIQPSQTPNWVPMAA